MKRGRFNENLAKQIIQLIFQKASSLYTCLDSVIEPIISTNAARNLNRNLFACIWRGEHAPQWEGNVDSAQGNKDDVAKFLHLRDVQLRYAQHWRDLLPPKTRVRHEDAH